MQFVSLVFSVSLFFLSLFCFLSIPSNSVVPIVSAVALLFEGKDH